MTFGLLPAVGLFSDDLPKTSKLMNTPSIASQVGTLQREKDYAEEALKTLARTLGSEGLTWTRVVYDAVQKIEQGSKMLGMATALNMDLQNKADMWRDEFQRIRAIVYDSDLHTNSEIAGICDRAITDIRSNISLIDQREKAADMIAKLNEEATATEEMLRLHGWKQEESLQMFLHRTRPKDGELKHSPEYMTSLLANAEGEIARLRDYIDHAQRTLNAALSASENDQVSQNRGAKGVASE